VVETGACAQQALFYLCFFKSGVISQQTTAMTTANRNLYSILSLLPAILLVIYFALFILMFVGMFGRMHEFEERPHEAFDFGQFGAVMIVGILLGIASLAALILFIIHVVNNKSLPDSERIIWILAFLFAGFVGFPLYWFMRGIKYESAAGPPAVVS
jgi:hypothetical protein